MGQQRVEDPEELLRLKEDILNRWERLPPEHQATMLLVLLERSEWSDWVLDAQDVLSKRLAIARFWERRKIVRKGR